MIKDSLLYRSIFALLIAMSITFSSCESVDREPPLLNLEEPQDNDDFVANSVVTLSGTARDNVGVSIVQAQITNTLNNQVVSSATGVVDADGRFNFDLRMGDRYSPTGDYQILVTAYDAAENRSSDFIEVFLREFPSKYYKTLFSASDAAGNATLYSYDTLDQLIPGPSIGQNITGFQQDNRAQHLLIGQRHGTVTAYYPNDFGVLFQLTSDGGPSNIGCTNLATFQNDFFWSSGYGNYLRRYSKEGILETTYDHASFPVYGVAILQHYVLAGLESSNGNILKLDRYDRTDGILRETKFLEWRPTFFGQVTEDRILVGGNFGGNGQLYYTVEDNINQVLDSTDVAQKVLGIASEGGHTWIRMENRVSTFDPDYRLGQPTISGEFTTMGWDSRRQQLWLGKEDAIEVYDASGVLLRTITGGFGTVTAIDFHYNK